MMAITDTQGSGAQLIVVSFKELNIKMIWPGPYSIVEEPILLLLILIKGQLELSCKALKGAFGHASYYSNLANSQYSRLRNN